MLLTFLLLLVLFAILSLSADLAVKHIKYIAGVLGIKLFAFGIILGIVTTLPELSVGINALIDNASPLALGNLLGGSMVLFGLILGGSLFLNKQIKTDGKISTILPEIFVIFSPVFFIIDGKLNILDGIIMVFLYIGLVFYLYKKNRTFEVSYPTIINKNAVLKSVIFSIIGIIIVLLSSHFIIEETFILLEKFNVSEILVGAIIFSIGTNLPEITIMLSSWRKKAGELSLSHLLSSGFTQILVLGVLSIIEPINVSIDFALINIMFFRSILLVLFLIFYITGEKIEKREGAVLFFLYILFLIINIILA